MSTKIDKMLILRTLKTSNILDMSRNKKLEKVFDHVGFAIWLRTNREKSYPYLNQATLAKKVGVVRQRISELEGGDKPLLPKLPSRPGLDLVESIAIALGVDINDARVAAGYSQLSNNHAESKEVAEGVKVILQGGKNLSDAQRDEFFRSAELIIKGIIADKANQ